MIQSRLESFYLNLLNLNPEISNIILTKELINGYQYERYNIYYHICYGIISKYTVRDINYFLLKCLLPSDEIRILRELEIQYIKKYIQVDFKYGIQWAACYDTLEEISKHLKINKQ